MHVSPRLVSSRTSRPPRLDVDDVVVVVIADVIDVDIVARPSIARIGRDASHRRIVSTRHPIESRHRVDGRRSSSHDRWIESPCIRTRAVVVRVR